MKGAIDLLTWKHDPVVPEGEKYSRKRMEDERGVRTASSCSVACVAWTKGCREHFSGEIEGMEKVLGFGMVA
jgi:hypothetical protein